MTAKKGDGIGKISASKWNKLDDVIDAYSKGQRPSSLVADDARDGIILVRNQTGSNRDVADVVGLSSPVITSSFADFALGLEFEGVLPTDGSDGSSDYTGKFAIYLLPCPAGDTAPALVIGPVAAKLSMQSADDAYADIYPGDASKLKSGSSGAAQIIWAQSASSYPADVFGMIRLANKSAAADDYTPCRNDSSYTVPPFGIMQITGVVSESSDALTLTVTRPTDVGRFDKYIINSAAPIPAGATGKGTFNLPHRLAYDHDDVTPSGEQTWGPKVDSFLAKEGPAYWKFCGKGPTVSGTHTMWVSPAILESYIVITPPQEEEAEDDTFIEAAEYSAGVLTPKSGFGKVQEKNDDEDLEETEQEELIWNIDPNDSVKCNKVLFVCQERRTGMDVVVMEICDALPESEE